MRTTFLNKVTLSEFTDLVEKDFISYQKMVEPVAGQLYISETIPENTGDSRRYDEMDGETFGRTKREGTKASKASVGVGYNKTMYATRIAMEIDITWEMRKMNKKPQVMAMLTSLKHFCPNRKELDLTHRITFCSSSTYTNMDGDTVDVTGGDSLPVVYAAHTLKYSSTTWRNRVANDPAFSRAAIEAAEALFNTDILSNFGERRVMTPNTIVSGDDPNTVNNIKQFLNSISDNEQNNSGVTNVYKGKYNHVILPYLATTATGAADSTKKRWWGLARIGDASNGFHAHVGVWEAANLKSPSAGNNGEDFSTDNWTYGARETYGICIVSGRGLVMSLPTS